MGCQSTPELTPEQSTSIVIYKTGPSFSKLGLDNPRLVRYRINCSLIFFHVQMDDRMFRRELSEKMLLNKSKRNSNLNLILLSEEKYTGTLRPSVLGPFLESPVYSTDLHLPTP